MIIYEERTSTYTAQVAIICDSCGAQSPKYDGWDPGYYNEERYKVSAKTGYSYPEGGQLQQTQLDFCPHCYETKVVPFLNTILQKPYQTYEKDIDL